MIMLSIFHLFACFWCIFFDEMSVPIFCPFFKWSCLSSYWVWSFLYILETSIFIRALTFKYFFPVCGNKDNFSPQKSHCCDSGMLLKLSPLLENKLSFYSRDTIIEPTDASCHLHIQKKDLKWQIIISSSLILSVGQKME